MCIECQERDVFERMTLASCKVALARPMAVRCQRDVRWLFDRKLGCRDLDTVGRDVGFARNATTLLFQAFHNSLMTTDE
jgi:hypothetical protein